MIREFICKYIKKEDNKKALYEIDGKITEIAKKYFFLDKLIKDYCEYMNED